MVRLELDFLYTCTMAEETRARSSYHFSLCSEQNLLGIIGKAKKLCLKDDALAYAANLPYHTGQICRKMDKRFGDGNTSKKPKNSSSLERHIIKDIQHLLRN